MLVEIEDMLLDEVREITQIEDNEKLVAYCLERILREYDGPVFDLIIRSMKRRKLDRTARPIVFLDIDDVLALNDTYGGFDVLHALSSEEEWPELWQSVFDKDAKRNLRQLYEEFNPSFVISSSWSRHLTKTQMIVLFERTGLSFVSSNLEAVWSTLPTWKADRAGEITSWLVEHRGERPFLILDDYESGYTLKYSTFYASGHVVLCSHGFQGNAMQSAMSSLHAQTKVTK